VPVGRLVDWVDQAHLYLHLDRIERGRAERRQARRTPPIEAPTQGDAPAAPEPEPPTGLDLSDGSTAAAANGAATAASSGAAPVSQEARVHGSVVAGNRAGTRTRVALRQLGIRNATDLLKAFPPDQIDPRSGSDGLASHFRHLPASGVDVDQVRVLVRVLDEDTGLAPVWNWQTRGSMARADARRPRSQVLPAPRRHQPATQPART
jgi:hypothetical protein